MSRIRSSAFSLIELIVVMLIMGAVGAVIVACFMGGVRAYERARSFGRGETAAYLAFEMMERDLRNSVCVPGLSFEGAVSVMQFATELTVPVLEGGVGVDVGVVRYWEGSEGRIVRSQEVLGESTVVYAGEGEALLSGDAAMRLAFRTASEGGASVEWMESWQSESNLPQQVRIQFSGGELGAATLERTVLIPVAEEE